MGAGNDFSTLYAPLIRDGRMEKYYWNPTRVDRIGVCKGIFKEDNLSDREVEELVDTFPGQTIDFFGALRARIYDDLVRGFTTQVCPPPPFVALTALNCVSFGVRAEAGYAHLQRLLTDERTSECDLMVAEFSRLCVCVCVCVRVPQVC